jgi:hypothetical protein
LNGKQALGDSGRDISAYQRPLGRFITEMFIDGEEFIDGNDSLCGA